MRAHSLHSYLTVLKQMAEKREHKWVLLVMPKLGCNCSHMGTPKRKNPREPWQKT